MSKPIASTNIEFKVRLRLPGDQPGRQDQLRHEIEQRLKHLFRQEEHLLDVRLTATGKSYREGGWPEVVAEWEDPDRQERDPRVMVRWPIERETFSEDS
jgi:hypothetical protein